tara:strand:+ start:82 stop:687 length:606 start_codon:yes stop_codon:yes gene_type:complete
MTLSREQYVVNTAENVEKLVRKVMEVMDFDTIWQSAYQGLTERYIDNDQAFVKDYYETFPGEDPELNKVQEKRIIYYHDHHSNPCVIGQICIPTDLETDPSGFEVIAITHNMIYQEYGDSLSDITKIWDAHVQIELTKINRYDTDYDACIHIPLSIGEHTTLSNQVLKQILIDKNVELVKTQYDGNQFTLDEFFTKCLWID